MRESEQPSAGGTEIDRFTSIVGWILLALGAAIFGGLVVYVSGTRSGDQLRWGTYAGAAALLIIIILRQTLALLSSRRLSGHLSLARRHLGTANEALNDAMLNLENVRTIDSPTEQAIVASLDRELERERDLTSEVVPANDWLSRTVDDLSAMIGARDHDPSGHDSIVVELAEQLGRATEIAASDVSKVKLAARLHDVGKVALPDAVLLKRGQLNDDEWMLMRRHPIVGAEIIGRIHGLGHLAPIIRSHHERWDGMGYPDGLVGEEIPLGARILAVADAYDAMTRGRVYQEARDPEWAMKELRRCAGSQFDPAIVQAMDKVISSRPGSRMAGKQAV